MSEALVAAPWRRASYTATFEARVSPSSSAFTMISRASGANPSRSTRLAAFTAATLPARLIGVGAAAHGNRTVHNRGGGGVPRRRRGDGGPATRGPGPPAGRPGAARQGRPPGAPQLAARDQHRGGQDPG